MQKYNCILILWHFICLKNIDNKLIKKKWSIFNYFLNLIVHGIDKANILGTNF